MIGLAIASDELRAVAVRDGVVHWTGRSAREPGRALSAQVADLLRFAPALRWRRAGVIAAIGPSGAQLKRLSGLPSMHGAGSMDALVREGVGRFFLRNGIPLATSGVRPAGADDAWAAAFELPLVREIEIGCRSARYSLRAIVPAVAVIMHGVRDGAAEWRDGPVAAEVVVRDGALHSVRRIATDATRSASSAPPAPPIAGMDEDAWRFADAYGAAFTSRTELLALRPVGQRDGDISRRRVVAASAALGASVCFAILGPVTTSTIVAEKASGQLTLLAPALKNAAAMEHELHRMSRALAEVDAFAASRRSPTRLLTKLAAALPEGASLVDVHVDGGRGSLVLLAPRAARAIAALDSVAELSAPEVAGPVTREAVGTRELERSTVRFTLAPQRAP